MSRLALDDGERVMVRYRCGQCGADARQWCMSKSGRWATDLHSDRFYAATRDGLLPLSMAADLRLSPSSPSVSSADGDLTATALHPNQAADRAAQPALQPTESGAEQ